MPTNLDTALSTLLPPGTEYVRLPRLIREVWSGLPELDREYIAQNVYFSVYSHSPLVPKGSKGITVWINDFQRRSEQLNNGGLSVPGITSDYYLIAFEDILDADTDTTDLLLRYVIVHEFAHAVQRHGLLTVCAVENKFASPIRPLDHYYYNESYADIQVFAWGFEDEFNCGQQNKIEAQQKFRENGISSDSIILPFARR